MSKPAKTKETRCACGHDYTDHDDGDRCRQVDGCKRFAPKPEAASEVFPRADLTHLNALRRITAKHVRAGRKALIVELDEWTLEGKSESITRADAAEAKLKKAEAFEVAYNSISSNGWLQRAHALPGRLGDDVWHNAVERAERLDAAEARVAETERRMREAGTPYSIEQDKINALVLRVETLEKALRDLIEHDNLIDEWNLTDPETPRGLELHALVMQKGVLCDGPEKCEVRERATAALEEKP